MQMNIMSSNDSSVDEYREVIQHVNNDVLEVGDSADCTQMIQTTSHTHLTGVGFLLFTCVCVFDIMR